MRFLDPMSLRGFLAIALLTALLFGVGLYLFLHPTGQLEPYHFIAIFIGSPEVGFLVAGCCYLGKFVRYFRRLHFAPAEVKVGETIL